MRKLLLIFIVFFATSNNAATLAATLDEMIGQMVLVGFDGKSADTASAKALVKDIAAGKVGGVLFLGHNIGSQSQVIGLTNAFQAASASKTLLTIDQEGGRVTRLKPEIGAPFLASAKQMTRLSKEAAHDKYFESALYLQKVGFNVNFGPVVDLEVNLDNPVIAKLERSFGAQPLPVSQYAFMFVDAHHRAGVLTALKHFPGHGSSSRDSHTGFVDISQSWSAVELDPFGYMIGWQAADMVMIAHVFLDVMSDDGKVPASLSRKAITDILRGQLGYEGVVVSDDMAMGAIAKNFTSQAAIIKAINAGTDLLMMSFNKDAKGSLGSWVHGVIKQAVASGQIEKQTIIDSFNRIQTLKNRLP